MCTRRQANGVIDACNKLVDSDGDHETLQFSRCRSSWAKGLCAKLSYLSPNNGTPLLVVVESEEQISQYDLKKTFVVIASVLDGGFRLVIRGECKQRLTKRNEALNEELSRLLAWSNAQPISGQETTLLFPGFEARSLDSWLLAANASLKHLTGGSPSYLVIRSPKNIVTEYDLKSTVVVSVEECDQGFQVTISGHTPFLLTVNSPRKIIGSDALLSFQDWLRSVGNAGPDQLAYSSSHVDATAGLPLSEISQYLGDCDNG